jgi:hypothetical protein
MKQVWKFPLPEAHRDIILDMPESARILSFQTQKVAAPAPKGHSLPEPLRRGEKPELVEVPTIWAEVEMSDMGGKPKMESRTFLLVGTGHEFEAPLGCELSYIGTTQLYGGAIILHLFEVVRK